MPKITVGRDESDIEEYGEELATAYIGKHIVGEQQEAHTANPLRLDVARPHVMGVFGKRGTGKSYTLGVLAEELKQADEEVQDNLSSLMIDSMGIFWSTCSCRRATSTRSGSGTSRSTGRSPSGPATSTRGTGRSRSASTSPSRWASSWNGS
ncbi:MAG: DUF87 domain-containing protein [Candidatus Nanohaloarchaea archaeon]|nr:DUF87 domain-containing protein [Candidatus Nanohaloarchaea archaeon]